MTASLTYHVAITLDGRIAWPDGTYDGFIENGDHVDAFLESINDYSAVLMGRRTYDVALRVGLPAGQPAYPGRPNYVFSRSLDEPLATAPEFHLVREGPEAIVRGLKTVLTGEIWLCGGGVLAGTLLEAGLVDVLLLKVNPIRPMAPAGCGGRARRFASCSRRRAPRGARAPSTSATDSGDARRRRTWPLRERATM